MWAGSGGEETPSRGGTIEAAHRVTARNVQCLKREQERCPSGLVKDSQKERDWVCGRVLRYLEWIAHHQQRLVPCSSSAIRCFPSGTYNIGCWLGDTVVSCVMDESPWEPREQGSIPHQLHLRQSLGMHFNEQSSVFRLRWCGYPPDQFADLHDRNTTSRASLYL